MIQMPRPNTPIAEGQLAPMSREWLQWMREFISNHHHVPVGAVVPFYISAADVANDANFIQAGANAGLGLGKYANWAVCNGNNGTPNLNGTFLRWNFLAAGGTGGSDSSAHTHSVTSNVAVADHPATATSAASAGATNSGAVPSTVTIATHTHNTPVLAHTVTNNAVTSGAASATDNRPAYYELLPMMRVA